MPDQVELNNTMQPWPFQQKIEVAGQHVTDLERYAIRWYIDPVNGCCPVLYLDGKRVAKKWRMILAVECEGDPDGGTSNANCA